MDTVSQRRRSEIMARVRSKDTTPELLVRRIVHSMGYRYTLHDKGLPGCPDLVFTSRRKIVFVHGCFWHRHRGCSRARIPSANREYWASKFERNRLRDALITRKLRAAGWDVMTVWECELADATKLAKRARTFLNE